MSDWKCAKLATRSFQQNMIKSIAQQKNITKWKRNNNDDDQPMGMRLQFGTIWDWNARGRFCCCALIKVKFTNAAGSQMEFWHHYAICFSFCCRCCPDFWQVEYWAQKFMGFQQKQPQSNPTPSPPNNIPFHSTARLELVIDFYCCDSCFFSWLFDFMNLAAYYNKEHKMHWHTHTNTHTCTVTAAACSDSRDLSAWECVCTYICVCVSNDTCWRRCRTFFYRIS